MLKDTYLYRFWTFACIFCPAVKENYYGHRSETWPNTDCSSGQIPPARPAGQVNRDTAGPRSRIDPHSHGIPDVRQPARDSLLVFTVLTEEEVSLWYPLANRSAGRSG